MLGQDEGSRVRRDEEGVSYSRLLELLPPLGHRGSSRLVVAPPTERG